MITTARRIALVTALTFGVMAVPAIAPFAAATPAGHVHRSASPAHTGTVPDPSALLDGLLGDVGKIVDDLVSTVLSTIGDLTGSLPTGGLGI